MPGLQRGPKAKLPRPTYSIFRDNRHLPAMVRLQAVTPSGPRMPMSKLYCVRLRNMRYSGRGAMGWAGGAGQKRPPMRRPSAAAPVRPTPPAPPLPPALCQVYKAEGKSGQCACQCMGYNTWGS